MSQGFHVRLATVDDADVVAWHRARMFQDMEEIPPHLFEAFRARSRDRLREMLESGEYIGWLASPADAPKEIIAGAGIQFRDALPHPADVTAFAEGRHAVVLNVFTEPKWRRQGLGALLLNRVIEWSRQEKLDRLILHASDKGRSLYERLGFVLTNEMRFVGDSKRKHQS